MAVNTPTGMVVVKKEDKEPKLRTLLIDGLAAVSRARAADPAASAVVRVVAQSMSSPVVQALAAVQAELSAAGVEARVVLAKADTAPQLSIGQSCLYRHLADVRCHDAHEFLVFGAATAWIGDCMRRDPATRDSFELHAAANNDVARGVAISFDKIWQIAVPFEAIEDRAGLDMAGDLAALGPDAAPAPQVLTRH